MRIFRKTNAFSLSARGVEFQTLMWLTTCELLPFTNWYPRCCRYLFASLSVSVVLANSQITNCGSYKNIVFRNDARKRDMITDFAWSITSFVMFYYIISILFLDKSFAYWTFLGYIPFKIPILKFTKLIIYKDTYSGMNSFIISIHRIKPWSHTYVYAVLGKLSFHVVNSK